MAPPRPAVLSQTVQRPDGVVVASQEGLPDVEVGNPTVRVGGAAKMAALARALREGGAGTSNDAVAADYAAGTGGELMTGGQPVVSAEEAAAFQKLGMQERLQEYAAKQLDEADARRKMASAPALLAALRRGK